jgi:translation elongation factor EF-G
VASSSVSLEDWSEDVLRRRGMTLTAAVRVCGLRDKHLGPRWDYARVVFLVEPAQEFKVVLGARVPDGFDSEYLESALLGFLDIAMTAEPFPLKLICITVEEAELHEVDSNIMAFRHAGRDAGRKLLQQLMAESLWSTE